MKRYVAVTMRLVCRACYTVDWVCNIEAMHSAHHLQLGSTSNKASSFSFRCGAKASLPEHASENQEL